ncbi:MAG: TonB-dependent receptor [Ignavibacteriota bacterium]
MNHIRIVLLTIALLLAVKAMPQNLVQNIRGQVVENVTKIPVEGAVVQLQMGNEKRGTETAKDGYFVIENVPPGRYNVVISMIGYNPITVSNVIVTTGKETFLNVQLESTNLSTEVITVIDELEKDKPLNNSALTSARSFSIDETKRFAGTFDDPMRAVQNFAGVMSSPNINSNGIVIRGNSPKGLLWRLDDVSIPNPNHFSYSGQKSGGLTIFSSQLLTNSDFFTSAFPSEYGNALSGVFDMKFRNGNSFKREHAVQVGIQGLDLASEGPLFKTGNSSYLINYRYSVLGFLQLIDKDMKNKVPTYQDLSFKINLPAGNAGTFTIFGIGGTDKSKFDPDADSTKWEKLDDRTKTTLNNTMGAFGLTYAVPLGRNTLLKTILSGSGQTVDYEKGFMNTSYNVEPVDNVSHKTSQLSGSAYINHKFSPSHLNKTGVTYTQMYFNSNISSQNQFTGNYETFVNDKGNTGIVQAYTQSTVNLRERLILSGGVNFSHFVLNSTSTVEPRLSAKYFLTDRSAISVGYGNHSQYEDISVYLSQNQTTGGTITKPNINLEPSRANHFVLGYDAMLSSNLHLKVEGYYQDLYNIPVMRNSYYSMLNNPGGYFNDSLVNTGTGKNIGVDVTFEKFLSNNFYYLFTASVFSSKYKGGDGTERNGRYNSNYAINLLAGKEFYTKSQNVWGLNLKASYNGGEYYIPVDLQESISQNREVLDYTQVYTKNLKPFLYLDFTVNYRVNYSKTSLVFTAQAKNILNSKTVLGYSYNSFTKTVDEQAEMGFLPMFSVKYEF